MKTHKLFAILMAAMVLSAFAGCQQKEASTLPATYQVGGVDVAALSLEDETGVTEASSEVYTYKGVKEPGVAVQSYVQELTQEENGFVVVNQDYVQVQHPNYSTEENQVFLAKTLSEGSGEGETSEVSAQEESSSAPAEGETEEVSQDQLLTMELSWSPGECVVTVGTDEGTIQLAEDAEPIEPMSENEMVDYFNSLTPADLGLSGESMSEYEVYVMGGNVLVDEHPCVKLQVYSRNNAGDTNQFVGMYLMSSGGEYIYRVDMDTGEASQLPIALPA